MVLNLYLKKKSNFEKFKEDLKCNLNGTDNIKYLSKEVKLNSSEIELELKKYLTNYKINNEISYNISEIVINNNDIDKFRN